MEFRARGGKRTYFDVGGGFSAAMTMIDFFSSRPSSSSPTWAGATRVRIPWKAILKYPPHVDIGRSCRNTWSSLVCWIPPIRKMNLDCMIRLNLTIWSRLKEKHIWAICARWTWSGSSDRQTCRSPVWCWYQHVLPHDVFLFAMAADWTIPHGWIFLFCDCTSCF